jgi:hypothetical protein
MAEERTNKRIDLKLFNSSPTMEGAATWPGGPALIHQNVTLLNCVSESILEEALAASDLKYTVVRRISPSAVLVNNYGLEELVKVLTKRGYEPKIIKQQPTKTKKV